MGEKAAVPGVPDDWEHLRVVFSIVFSCVDDRDGSALWFSAARPLSPINHFLYMPQPSPGPRRSLQLENNTFSHTVLSRFIFIYTLAVRLLNIGKRKKASSGEGAFVKAGRTRASPSA